MPESDVGHCKYVHLNYRQEIQFTETWKLRRHLGQVDAYTHLSAVSYILIIIYARK